MYLGTMNNGMSESNHLNQTSVAVLRLTEILSINHIYSHVFRYYITYMLLAISQLNR